jgi:hypothetical protein
MKKSEIRIIESFQKKEKKFKKKFFYLFYYKNFHNSKTTQDGKLTSGAVLGSIRFSIRKLKKI